MDGAVLQFWRPATQSSVPDVFGKYSTGEAFYALALLRGAFPDEGWERPAHRIVGYLATRRDAAEGHSYRQADHWAAYGLGRAGAGRADRRRGRVRPLAVGLLRLPRALRVAAPGRSLDPFASESGASIGTVGEATAALWRLSGEDPGWATSVSPSPSGASA